MKKATVKKTATSKTKKVVAKKAEYKLDAKTIARIENILGVNDEDGEAEEGEGEGKIAQILRLYVKGISRKDIVAFGFNKSTVYRQSKELDRYKKAPAMQYFGHDLYEARIQRLMKAKGISRDKAVTTIASKDLD